jgi:hypothetical protein
LRDSSATASRKAGTARGAGLVTSPLAADAGPVEAGLGTETDAAADAGAAGAASGPSGDAWQPTSSAEPSNSHEVPGNEHGERGLAMRQGVHRPAHVEKSIAQ